MTLNQFAIFAAVAKHRNLTKASAELRVSQPWVSQQLRLLEADYGVTFCVRTSRGVDLTEEGQLFLSKVAPILAQVQQLKAAFKRSRRVIEPTTLNIGATVSAGPCLPWLLARFQKTHPAAEIDFRIRDSVELEKLVFNSQLDLGMSTHRPHSAHIAWEPFIKRKMVMIAAPTHPAVKRRELGLHEVLRYPLVVRLVKGRDGTTARLVRRFASQGCEIKIAARCDTPETVKAAVKANMGIGLLFEDVVKLDARRGEFKILPVRGLKMHGETFIIHSTQKPLSPLAQEFLPFLRRWRTKDGTPAKQQAADPAAAA